MLWFGTPHAPTVDDALEAAERVVTRVTRQCGGGGPRDAPAGGAAATAAASIAALGRLDCAACGTFARGPRRQCTSRVRPSYVLEPHVSRLQRDAKWWTHLKQMLESHRRNNADHNTREDLHFAVPRRFVCCGCMVIYSERRIRSSTVGAGLALDALDARTI